VGSLEHVLVVDDDTAVRAALAEALEGAGLRVDLAADGAAGLEHLRRGPPPAVIVVDLRVAQLRGEEFLRELRADPRFEHVPVITMTAGLEPPDGDGVLAYLHEPFDVGDLLGIVLSLTGASAA
jgi:CheY-like chemotaxis protein